MGRKTSYFAFGVCGAAFFLRVIGMFLPLHEVSIDTPTSQEVLALTTKCLTVEVELFRGMCDLARNARMNICPDVGEREGAMYLKEGAKEFCVEHIEAVIPKACLGLKRAYFVGIGLVILVVADQVLEITSAWLMFRYLTVSPKKQYRQTALKLVACGAIMVAVALVSYYAFVLTQLNAISPKGYFQLVSQRNNGTNVAIGYILLWFSVLLEVGAAFLLARSKTPDEDDFNEAMMQQEYEQEMVYPQSTGMVPPPYYPDTYNTGCGYGGEPIVNYGMNYGGGEPVVNCGPYGYGQPGFGFHPGVYPGSQVPNSVAPAHAAPENGAPGWGQPAVGPPHF